MKLLIATIAILCVLAGCSGNRNTETERRLAEAQQQLEEATKALEEARQSAADEAAKASAQQKVEQAKKAVQQARQSANEAAKEAAKTTAQQQPQTTPAAPLTPEPAPEPKPEPPRTFTVPAGTTVSVRTHSLLSSKTSKDGTVFEGSLTQPLTVDGHVVAPKGALVEGVVVAADQGGRVKGKASLTLALSRLETADAGKVPIETARVVREAKAETKKDAAKVGIATGIGAAIGAIAGGGKGAAIGAGAGAAGGTGVVLGTRGAAAEIPAESILTFKLAAPITVQEKR